MEGRTSRLSKASQMIRIQAALLALLLLPATGCSIFGSGSNPPHIAAMQHPQLPGIPVPDGFGLVPEHSENHISGQSRFAKLEFKGDVSVQRVVQFYREQMPGSGFNETLYR